MKYPIGWCPFCDQGWAEIVKEISTNKLLIMCSECNTIWNSPQDFQDNKPNAGYQFTIGKVLNPAIDEIKLKSWDGFIDHT